jgi:hypothetical protein
MREKHWLPGDRDIYCPAETHDMLKTPVRRWKVGNTLLMLCDDVQ